jgi:hypothetical protein
VYGSQVTGRGLFRPLAVYRNFAFGAIFIARFSAQFSMGIRGDLNCSKRTLESRNSRTNWLGKAPSLVIRAFSFVITVYEHPYTSFTSQASLWEAHSKKRNRLYANNFRQLQPSLPFKKSKKGSALPEAVRSVAYVKLLSAARIGHCQTPPSKPLRTLNSDALNALLLDSQLQPPQRLMAKC